jgi:hypothetical protein
MKTRMTLVSQIVAVCLALSAASFAADASFYIVHGIPGRNLAESLNPGLPVDILLNYDACVAHGLTFGNIAGPYTLPPGQYSVQISPANTLAPCTNPPLIDADVTLNPGAAVSGVIALGNKGPTLLNLTDNLSPVAPGVARFVFANSGDTTPLKATLTQIGVTNPQTFTITSQPGAEASLVLPAGTYDLKITSGGSAAVLTSQQIALAAQSVELTYAVGSASNNSVSLVIRVVKDVF